MVCLPCLFSLVAATGSADPPRPPTNAVSDIFTPVAFDQQHLGGLFANRLRANTEGYLEGINEEELLQSAQRGTDKSSSGSRMGLFLQAAADAYEYTNDAHLKTIMDRVARGLIQQTQDSGVATQAGSPAQTGGQVLRYGNALAGLLAYSYTTGNDEAFGAARRIADLVVKTSGPGERDNKTTPDIASAVALMRPMIEMYRHTGDSRYLSSCKYLATLRPQQLSLQDSLVQASGFAELYRLTGDESYKNFATSTWRNVHKEYLSIAGAPDSQKVSGSDQPDSSSGSSACQTVAWMQLTLGLLRITGEAQYAEQLEWTLYNQLLAHQNSSTGKLYSCVALEGSKTPAANPDECTSAAALGIAEIPEGVWGRFEDGLAVLSYSSGRARVRLRRRATVELISEGNYPETGNILLHIEPSHDIRFPLRLRVPAWTRSFLAQVGDNRLTGSPGEYLTIDREWKRGDTVRIEIDMTTHLRMDAGHPGEIAIERGPQLLALGKRANPGIQDFRNAVVNAESVTALPLPVGDPKMPFDAMSDQAYRVAGEYNGNSQQLVFLPFAEAITYRVWIKGTNTGGR